VYLIIQRVGAAEKSRNDNLLGNDVVRPTVTVLQFNIRLLMNPDTDTQLATDCDTVILNPGILPAFSVKALSILQSRHNGTKNRLRIA